jgi:hypothetical protein
MMRAVVVLAVSAALGLLCSVAHLSGWAAELCTGAAGFGAVIFLVMFTGELMKKERPR